MSFLDDWLAAGGKHPSKLGRFSIDNDRWDVKRFDQMLKEMRTFNAERKALCEVATETGNGLWADAFFAFNKVGPKLNDPKGIQPKYLINRAVMDEAMKLPEFERLKNWTEGDQVAAAGACIAIRPELEQLYDRTRTAQKRAEEYQEKINELLAAQDEQRDLDELVKDWSEQSDPKAEDYDGEAADYQAQQSLIQAQVDQLLAEAEAAGEAAEDEVNACGPMVKAVMKSALNKAADEAEEAAAMARMWGLEPGALVRLPADQRLELAKRLNNDRFKRMADLFGPLERLLATEQQRRVNYVPEEVYDVGIGKDLERLLPAEYGRLLHPLRRLEFYKDYTEGKLLQYELRGTEKVGRGGIVCCDEATQILTAEGWKRHDELTVGEEVLTLNHETGLSEWQPLVAVHVFPEERREMLSLESRCHSSLTTMEHRWPALVRRGTGTSRGFLREWRTSETLRSDDKLVLAAPCTDMPLTPKYEDALVELVAWTTSEGTLPPPGSTIRIYQSHRQHPQHCASIRSALTALYGPASTEDMRSLRSTDSPFWREEANDDRGVTTFHLNRVASGPILAHMDEHKAVAPSFVRGLTTSQLRLFVDRCIDADGHRYTGDRHGTLSFGQRLEARNHAFEIACILLGEPVHTRRDAETRPGFPDGTANYVTMVNRTTTAAVGERHVVEHDGIVWCPTTPNSTWLARRNGTVWFTGNCCIDNSGSMCGDRELWAKAVGLCLLHLSRIQKRKFYGIHFGSTNELTCFDFTHGDYDLDKIIDFAEFFYGGGTAFVPPLSLALDRLRTEFDHDGAVDSDLVFITDGQCGVPATWQAEFMSEMKRIGSTLWGLNIGGGRKDQPLYDLADGKVATISDVLNSSKELRHIFGAL